MGFLLVEFFRARGQRDHWRGCIRHLAGDTANPLEIGWRLRPDNWGQGYAGEAARRMAAFAFETTDTPILLAVAHPENIASQNVMKRLGMRYRGIEKWYGGDRVTYILGRQDWPTRSV